ncbi:MAG: inorganic diphosphatase [Alphaproteobacteria bacterium]
MDLNKLPIGKNAPYEINVIVEVPMGSAPVKYELDKDSGFLFVDRFIQAAMNYPCNYGFIPHTLSEDGDPADVLVYGDLPVVPMSVIAVRPIGVLLMEDESGKDEKILAVPTSKLTPFFDNIKTYKDLPEIVTLKISHFFENYKKLEKNKWVKILGWESEEKAHQLINEAVERYNSKS